MLKELILETMQDLAPDYDNMVPLPMLANCIGETVANMTPALQELRQSRAIRFIAIGDLFDWERSHGPIGASAIMGDNEVFGCVELR